MCIEMVFLGTGSSSNPKRAQSSLLIDIDGSFRIVIDLGCRAYNILKGLGLTSQDIDLFAFTHAHYDHICGLPLMIFSESFSRSSLIKIIADDLTWDTILKLYKTVRRIGGKHEASLKRISASPCVFNPSKDIEIELFPVAHTIEAYGVKISTGGLTIVISGDTSPTKNVIKRASSATIVVHEATLPSNVSLNDEIKEGHTSVKKAVEIASLSAYKGFLYHISDRSEYDAILYTALSKGKVVIPEDTFKYKLC